MQKLTITSLLEQVLGVILLIVGTIKMSENSKKRT